MTVTDEERLVELVVAYWEWSEPEHPGLIGDLVEELGYPDEAATIRRTGSAILELPEVLYDACRVPLLRAAERMYP